MSYCTQDDLAWMLPPAQLAELTTDSGNDPDPDVISRVIAAADAEIDAYLRVRYKLPLAEPIPVQVKSLSADLAIYKLYLRRSLENAARLQAYKDAITFLQLVTTGLAVIEGADGLEEPGAVENVTEIDSADRIFNRDSLHNF